MFNTISIWSIILNVIVLLVTGIGFIKIMSNDLKHLSADIKEIKETLNKSVEHYHALEKKMIRIETRCKIMHKK